MVIVEAAARGVPSVVIADPDNAATELIEAGVNGFIADSADPQHVARAILMAIEGGERLRHKTLDWYHAHAADLSIEGSLERVETAYA